jgi:hypothetical protein
VESINVGHARNEAIGDHRQVKEGAATNVCNSGWCSIHAAWSATRCSETVQCRTAGGRWRLRAIAWRVLDVRAWRNSHLSQRSRQRRITAAIGTLPRPTGGGKNFGKTILVFAIRCLLFLESDLLTAPQRNVTKGQQQTYEPQQLLLLFDRVDSGILRPSALALLKMANPIGPPLGDHRHSSIGNSTNTSQPGPATRA